MTLLLLLSAEGRQSFRPTVDDIGVLLHARTNVMGTELGTFTAETAVTADAVNALIDMAFGAMQSRIGTEDTVPAIFWTDALRLVALHAATMIEASFFPNQLDSDRSAYNQYTAMYAIGLPVLVDAIKAYGQGSAPGVVDDAPSPTFAFPAACPSQLDHAFSTVPVVSPWVQWGWPSGVAPPG